MYKAIKAQFGIDFNNGVYNDMHSPQIASVVGVSERTIRAWRAECSPSVRLYATENGSAERNDQPVETIEVTGDRMVCSKVTNNRVKTLPQLLKEFEVDETSWIVNKWSCGTYEVTTKNNDGVAETHQMYKTNATFVRSKGASDVKNIINALIDNYGYKAPVYTPVTFPKSNGMLYCPSIYDHHFGKKSWERETGQNYSLNIATKRYNSAVDYFINLVKGYDTFEEALLVVGHDLVNVDSKASMTTAGTPQDCDTRYWKICEEAIECQIRHINILRDLTKMVKVVCIPGNHDEMTSQWIGRILQQHFRTDANVVFDIEPKKRKYHKFGKSLIGMTHESKSGGTNLPMIMAKECEDIWSETKYRKWLVGHLHKDEQKDKLVPVEFVPSLCSYDSWISENEFVLSTQAAKLHLFSKDIGNFATFTIPLEGINSFCDKGDTNEQI